jgi:NAD(P)-dependent dehydrogenase (short-subunit alcohol dehydrogenase family)
MTSTSDFYKGKVAFVTGAGSGIGRATSLAFAREGASVAVVDVSDEGIHETIRLIEVGGGRALGVHCDVIRTEDVRQALEKTIEAFGRLDFAFNNAGIEQRNAALADFREDEFERIMNVNVRGVYTCMKYQIPLILQQGGGAIVNTSSGAGVIGIKGGAAYAASKHAVIGLTKSAALDYAGQNLRINVVAPGYIETPMMDRFTGGTQEGWDKIKSEEPIGRAGNPEEIADAVLWLCSDQASFVIGHALVVDGGQTIA